MEHEVFISYSSKNKNAADAICHLLEENGIKCWIAPRDIPAGSEYGDLIDIAIKDANVFVIVFSRPASVSQWVKGELNIAFNEQKIIIPFKIDSTPFSGQNRLILENKHWIDAYPDYETKFKDLLDAVKSALNIETKTLPTAENVEISVETPAEEEEIISTSEPKEPTPEKPATTNFLDSLKSYLLKHKSLIWLSVILWCVIIVFAVRQCHSAEESEIAKQFPDEWFERKTADDIYNEAEYFSNRGMYDEYLYLLNLNGENGHAKSQAKLGEIFDKGIYTFFENSTIIAPDKEKAAYWYTKAAEQGIAEACFKIGEMYHEGEGVFQDQGKAIEWLSKAANTNYAPALSLLGKMYLLGWGVTQDTERGLELYIKAAGYDEEGDIRLELADKYLNGGSIDKDWEKAFYWYKAAAECHKPQAYAGLGYITYFTDYDTGNNDPISRHKTAFEWFEKVFKPDNSAAQNIYSWDDVLKIDLFADRFRTGKDERRSLPHVQDIEFAIKLYELIANSDATVASHAAYDLGKIYENGEAGQVNTEKAIEWYEKSAAADFRNAIDALERLKGDK